MTISDGAILFGIGASVVGNVIAVTWFAATMKSTVKQVADAVTELKVFLERLDNRVDKHHTAIALISLGTGVEVNIGD